MTKKKAGRVYMLNGDATRLLGAAMRDTLDGARYAMRSEATGDSVRVTLSVSYDASHFDDALRLLPPRSCVVADIDGTVRVRRGRAR